MRGLNGRKRATGTTPGAAGATRAATAGAAALALAGLAGAWVACSRAESQPAPGPAPGAAPVAAPAPVTATTAGPPAAPAVHDLLAAMAKLTGASLEPDAITAWAGKLEREEATLDAFLDELLANERFSSEVTPSLVFGAFVNVRNYYALPFAFVLKRPAEGDAPLYLRAPCTAAEGIAVKPWWNLRTQVRVCPDAYRPDKWTLVAEEHSYKTRSAITCDSQVGSPELETHPLCGCGPNLIRCLRDEEQYNDLNRSFMDEVKQTTAWVVEHDLPMASLFTGNATFRDRNVEAYYRRQKIGALELKRVERELEELDAWPQGGTWAPREEVRPGQHAGVLTAPQILHWLPDRRQRQRGYYEIMWCTLRNSFGATTHKVLELNASGNNFFVHDSWQRLAHTELCTDCHARLDYGSQFFNGYLDSRASTHYNPALHGTGTGPLYGRDIHDPRGTAPLTPLGFAKLATDQPDFSECMTSQFVHYVLGARATAADVEAVEAAVAQTKTFKGTMKAALARYAARWREDAGFAAPGPSSTATEARRGPKGGMLIGPELRAQLDQHCTECHSQVPYADTADTADLPFDLTGPELPRALLVSSADQVAFGMMPKGVVLDPVRREALVELLIEALWTDAAARQEARRYYLGRWRGLPAQQLDNVFHAIGQRAGAASELGWGALERGIWSDQHTITPGFLAVTGLDALRACARAVETRDLTLEDCLTRATAINSLSRWPAPAR